MTRRFIPYIRNISPRLVSLTVPSLAQFHHLTPVLEENNCLLEELVCLRPINSTEITQITESSQAHIIQKLSIGKNHGWNHAFMNHLSNLTALTDLIIFGSNGPPVSVNNRCEWTTPSFYLCGLKLSHLEVRHCLPSSSSHVLIVMLCNNEKRWYTENSVSKWIIQPNGLLLDSPAMHSLAFDQYDGFPFATFICDSFYSFFMVNVLI